MLLARTGSGRTTYRSSSNDTRNISLEDVGIFLNAIEADGGTAGGRSRWGKCLARIPYQVRRMHQLLAQFILSLRILGRLLLKEVLSY